MTLTSAAATEVVVPLYTGVLKETFDSAIEYLITQLPRAIAGIAILLVGVYLGSKVQVVVGNLCWRMDLDQRFDAFSIPSLFGDSPGGLSRAVAILSKYYVILFAAFIAADVTDFQELNPWLETLVVWLPHALAGIAVILVGLVVTDYAVRQTRDSEVVAESEFGAWIPASVRAVLYVIVFVIGLDMIGINLEIVYLIAEGVTSAIGLGITAALALGLGVAVGLLAKDYVDRELDRRAEAED